MNCPNCGKPYSPNELVCTYCKQPVGNAVYSELHTRPKKSRTKKILIPVFILLFVLIAAGIAYYVYLNIVEKRCRQVTDQIFTAAKTYDLSAFPQEDLPEDLRGVDLRQFMAERITSSLSESALGSYIDISSLDIDWDPILDEIASEAEYEITDVRTDYHSCKVTVHTKNKDFSGLPSALISEVKKQITNQDSSLWESVKEKFFSFFSGENSSDQNTVDLEEFFMEIFTNAKNDLPLTEYDGEIVYGIKNGSWTILSYDENLFYKFYGMPEPQSQEGEN